MSNPDDQKLNAKTSELIKRVPRPKARVIRLTPSNLIFLALFIFALMVTFNSLINPRLGEEVSIDTFLNNIKDNRYSRVDIRSDGNAVGSAKYVETVEAANANLSGNNATDVKDAGGLESKSLTEVVELFKLPSDPVGVVKQFFGQGKYAGLRELYIFEDRLLLDWADNKRADWVVNNVEEAEFAQELTSANIDLASLPVRVSYLRSATTAISTEVLNEGYKNSRYQSVWKLDNTYFARVSSQRIAQNFVNYGVVTSDFTKFLQEEGINLGSQNIKFNVLPIYQIDYAFLINLLLVGGLLFTGFMLLRSINSSNGGLSQFGRSKARMFFGQKMNVTFKDVAGVDEAKEELREVVDFLKNPSKYTKLGAKIPRGVLMVGEPGTGKTLLARAVAGEAGVPFFHTSGSEFEEMLVGAGASRVRDLFDKAKKASPALIFIDEIDAVGRKRGTTIQSSSTEQTLNQILVEMDGFEVRDNVIVIAATNRPDVLDPALLRPGRFDRKVVLDAPDIEGRKAILSIHAQDKPLATDVDLEKVAKRTVGFSGADLANMLNEAAIIVAKDSRKEITPHDIEEAATKVQAGPIRKRKRSQDELKMTAYHEAAHALVMKKTPQSDPVHRITILSRGMALGYTMPLPENDQLQMTKTKMESKIMSLLAGWASEELVFNDVTTGASNDIEKATSIARRMVKQFGMSKKLGLINYGSADEQPHMGWYGRDKNYSEATAEIIDEEVRTIIHDCYERSKAILVENRAVLDKLADLLLEQEVVEGVDFEKLF